MTCKQKSRFLRGEAENKVDRCQTKSTDIPLSTSSKDVFLYHKHLWRTWLGGVCCKPAGPGSQLEGAAPTPRAERCHASGSCGRVPQQTVFGCLTGPGSTRVGHSETGSHRPDANLGAHRRQKRHVDREPFAIGDFLAPSLKAGPSGSTSLMEILLFCWPSLCPVTAKPESRQREGKSLRLTGGLQMGLPGM